MRIKANLLTRHSKSAFWKDLKRHSALYGQSEDFSRIARMGKAHAHPLITEEEKYVLPTLRIAIETGSIFLHQMRIQIER